MNHSIKINKYIILYFHNFQNCSTVYSKVEEEQKEIYRFQFYSMIEEFHYKPILAPPFSLFIYVYAIFWILFAKCCEINDQNKVAADNQSSLKIEKNVEIIDQKKVEELDNTQKAKIEESVEIQKKFKKNTANLISNWTDNYNFHGLILKLLETFQTFFIRYIMFMLSFGFYLQNAVKLTIRIKLQQIISHH